MINLFYVQGSHTPFRMRMEYLQGWFLSCWIYLSHPFVIVLDNKVPIKRFDIVIDQCRILA